MAICHMFHMTSHNMQMKYVRIFQLESHECIFRDVRNTLCHTILLYYITQYLESCSACRYLQPILKWNIEKYAMP